MHRLEVQVPDQKQLVRAPTVQILRINPRKTRENARTIY